jgi:hypothetical protein
MAWKLWKHIVLQEDLKGVSIVFEDLLIVLLKSNSSEKEGVEFFFGSN